MRSQTGFTVCLFLMIVIALAEYRTPVFHPLTALDRALMAVSSQNDLGRTLHAARIAAEGK